MFTRTLLYVEYDVQEKSFNGFNFTRVIRGGSRISIGGAPTLQRGRQDIILPKFPKNCMKLRKFWSVRGGGPGALLGSAIGHS